MLRPDLLTLDTLLSSAIWGGAGAALALVAHGWRERDFLIWRLTRWRRGEEEPYPEPEGYVFHVVTPEERGRLPQHIASFAAMGALYPVLIASGEVIATIAVPLLLAIGAIVVALVTDDAEEVGAPFADRPSRWQRIRPQLMQIGFVGLGLLAFANYEEMGPIAKVAGLPPVYFWAAALLLVLGGLIWLRNGGAAKIAEAWAEEDRRGLATTLAALACSLAFIGLLVLALGMW